MSLIFSLNFFLSKSTGKFGVLLGSFLKIYTDASDYEIGLVLTSVPLVMTIAKPILCTMMDRMQAHKLFLIMSYGFLCFGYLPFVIIPFLGPSFYIPHARMSLYILTAFNIIADVGSAVVETLDDTLAVNYAKQVNSRFTIYRMWGTISYGLLSLLVGHVNDGFWIVPKYTAVYLFLFIGTLSMMLLIHLWPNEHFKIAPCDRLNYENGQPIPRETTNFSELNTLKIMRQRFIDSICYLNPIRCLCRHKDKFFIKENRSDIVDCNLVDQDARETSNRKNETSAINSLEFRLSLDPNGKSVQYGGLDRTASGRMLDENETLPKMTQVRIFGELIWRDPRIIAYLSIIAFCGTTLQLQYFLFLYLTGSCNSSNGCNYSKLAGFMQAAAAFFECLTFLVSEPLVNRFGRLFALKLAMFSLVIRFVFYGAFFHSYPPYFAIFVEALFGIVTGIYSTVKPEVAYMFANEVSLVLPQLVERGKISLSANVDAMKKCLASSMQGAFSLSYSGLGRTAGAVIAGSIIGLRGHYEDLWLFSAGCCFTMGFTFAIVKAFSLYVDLRPKMIRSALASN